MTQFQRDARYAQSDKFLKVWINYVRCRAASRRPLPAARAPQATMTEEAEAVFEELNRLQLGRSRGALVCGHISMDSLARAALFYHSYALVLEDRGQLRESLATYNEVARKTRGRTLVEAHVYRRAFARAPSRRILSWTDL